MANCGDPQVRYTMELISNEEKKASLANNLVHFLPFSLEQVTLTFDLCSLTYTVYRKEQERTLEEHRKLLHKVVKRDQKRRKRIEAAGIEYQCPQLVSNPITRN